jgi:hypothetical protein
MIQAARRRVFVATPTTVMCLGERKSLPAEQDAYVWLIEKFLRIKPDLFADPKSAPYVCKGGRGAAYFATCGSNMNQPMRLANGWGAELCLSNDQKVRILDNVAQYAGLKRGRDWEWQAENIPTREFIDVEALRTPLTLISVLLLSQGCASWFAYGSYDRPAHHLLGSVSIFVAIYCLVVGLPYALLWRAYKRALPSFTDPADAVSLTGTNAPGRQWVLLAVAAFALLILAVILVQAVRPRVP